jgi:hypothetical protein
MLDGTPNPATCHMSRATRHMHMRCTGQSLLAWYAVALDAPYE